MTDRRNSSLSLHQLLNEVNDAVRSAMPSTYWVRAEILQVRHASYWAVELSSYEDGKKAKATAMIWASQAAMVKNFESTSGTQLAKGLKVLVRVEVGFHPEYGLRLTIQEFDPTFTLGDMEARLNIIRQRLKERGEIDLNKKLPLPRDFTRVAVISPREAAGLGDFKSQADELAKNGLCRFDYFPALFQGEKSESSIIAAMLKVIDEHKARQFDCIVIIRGGGDKAGLYELNNMKLARGVCRLPVPVLVGIGHERDSTVLDEVANRFFPTPSLVIAHIMSCVIDNARDAGKSSMVLQQRSAQLMEMARHECRQEHDRVLRLAFESVYQAHTLISSAHHTITIAPMGLLNETRTKLEHMKIELQHDAKSWIQNQRDQTTHIFRDITFSATQNTSQARADVGNLKSQISSRALACTGNAQRTLERLNERVLYSARSLLQSARSRVEQHNNQVIHLNPTKILARGFALVMNQNGSPVTEAAQLTENTAVKLKFRDGEATATIETTPNE